MKEQFVKMATDIVAANATGRGVSTEQLVEMLKSVGQTLEDLSKGPISEAVPAAEEKPALTWQDSINKNFITCLVCGFQGITLNAHIRRKHNLNSKEYAAQFGIPGKIALVSKAYSAKRSKMAKESNLGENLKKARETKKEAAVLATTKPKASRKSKKEAAAVQE